MDEVVILCVEALRTGQGDCGASRLDVDVFKVGVEIGI